VLLALVQAGRAADCLPPIRASLALLAAPVFAAAFTRTQVWMWICALIWTATLAGWRGQLDGTCAMALSSGSLLR